MRNLIEYTLITLDGVIEAPKRWSNFDEESAALAWKRLDDFDAYVIAAPPPNVTLLGPDVADAIRRLKEQPGKDLIKYGTSRLDALLLEERLLDQLHLWYIPVVVGAGQPCSRVLTPHHSSCG